MQPRFAGLEFERFGTVARRRRRRTNPTMSFQCPRCNYIQPLYWKPALNNNPQGAVWVARFDELQLAEKQLADKVLAARGSDISIGIHNYYFGKKATYVHRVLKSLYLTGGHSVFHIPHEKSRRYLAHKVKGQTRLGGAEEEERG